MTGNKATEMLTIIQIEPAKNKKTMVGFPCKNMADKEREENFQMIAPVLVSGLV